MTETDDTGILENLVVPCGRCRRNCWSGRLATASEPQPYDDDRCMCGWEQDSATSRNEAKAAWARWGNGWNSLSAFSGTQAVANKWLLVSALIRAHRSVVALEAFVAAVGEHQDCELPQRIWDIIGGVN